ncbi:IS110 family RNA-guided transposase [Glutamicibacter sp. X7]
MPRLWAGIDAGKTNHHLVAIDTEGKRLISKKFSNDETLILEIIAEVNELADGDAVTWATDLNRGGAALLIALMHAHDQTLLYIPGRTVFNAARTYRGDGKTDAKDAGIIADQARMRRDLTPVRLSDDIATDLRLLTAHRTDLVTDRTRAINRMRATLLEFFPGLERAFDYAKSKAALTLLTGYQTPEAIRRLGEKRLTTWLRNQGARSAANTAERAVAAAKMQHTTVPGQEAGAKIVSRLATEILRLHEDIDDLDRQIETRFRQHTDAEVLLSMPGFGPLLASEFLAAVGGSITQFDSADRLAGVAGLAPAPRDSGRISGNHHRPKRYDRRLLRACFLAAQVAAKCCPISKAYYERKRASGKNHKQAVLALARRRLNVLWAMLRDHTVFGHGLASTTASAA